jgi:uncharacterized protein DUF937
MAESIVMSVMQYFSPSIVDQLASTFGESRDNAQKGVTAAVPAMLAGLAGMVARPGGTDRLAAAVQQQDPGILGNLSNMIGGGGQQALGEKGGNLLSSLFGNQTFEGISGTIARYAGVAPGSAAGLMGLIAPVVMAVLGRHQSSLGLDAAGLGRFLTDQKSAIANAMPAGLGSRLASVTGMPEAAVETLGKSVPKVEAMTPPRPTGIPSWAYALGALVILALIGYWVWGARGPQQVAQLPEHAASSVMVGQLDVGKHLSTVLDSATKSLNGVSDAASARNALPELNDAVAQLDKVHGMAGQIPSEGKKTLATIASSAKPALLQKIQSVQTLPGVHDVLRPTLDKLQARLDSMTTAT